MEENEQYIIDYLKILENSCPKLLELFYPITLMAINYLYEFDDSFQIDFEDIEFDEMDINTTINLVREFLGMLGEDYLIKFNNALNDGTFDIFHIDSVNEGQDRSTDPKVNEEGHNNINQPINYTILDGITIVHEFLHFTNSDKESMVRDVFTELISCYMELRYCIFLSEKGYNVDNYYKTLYGRLENTFDAANNVALSGSILDIYHNTGSITIDNIEFMDEHRGIYESNIDDILDFYEGEELGQGVYDFDYDVAYLIGWYNGC